MPRDWRDEDAETIATAIDILNKQAAEAKRARSHRGR
jgi:hypothetical protein